jgi:hypothetical protein
MSNEGKPLFVRIRNAKVGSSTLFTGTKQNNGLASKGADPLSFVLADVTTDVSASAALPEHPVLGRGAGVLA